MTRDAIAAVSAASSSTTRMLVSKSGGIICGGANGVRTGTE